MTGPSWVHAIWWQVYPLGFVGTFPTAERRAQGNTGCGDLSADFDRAIELEASGIALGPTFASRAHGYDTTDRYLLDHRLGDDADFDYLVPEGHRRSLRVLLDGVFN